MTYNLHRGFVMNRVSLDLRHCYGIKSLQQDFDFGKTAAYARYAPDGAWGGGGGGVPE
jgi:hypothetical protein